MKKPLLLTVFALAVLWFAIDALLGFGAATPDSRSTAQGGGSGQDGALVVGSANFPENALLAELYAGALSAAGFDVDTALNLGSREVLFPAMENGDITIVPEYTGALLDYLAGAEAAPASSTDEQVTQLVTVLPEGLRLLDPSTAQDQETVTCRPEVVERYELETLDDLGPVSGELVMGGPPELAQRAGRFSLAGLKSAYGIEFAEFKPLDVAGPLTVAALKAGKIDCANLFSTQSAITTNGFISLSDPQGLIESQAVVPLLTHDAASPDVTRVLDQVSAALDTDSLREMVKQVEVDKTDAAVVAQVFLAAHGLD